MKAINDTIPSPFNDWFAFQKSLDWNDDRNQDENAQKTFLEALRQGISRSKAFYEVANRINQAGITVDWQKLHDLWRLVRCQWNAPRSDQGQQSAPPIPPMFNGHDTQNAISASAPHNTNARHQNNKHNQHRNGRQPYQRPAASLISYYV